MPKKTSPSAKKNDMQGACTKGPDVWSQALPVMMYAPSPYGHICTSKEFWCCRCLQKTKLVLPEHLCDAIDREELAGDALINGYAEELGWIHAGVALKNGEKFLYTLCPDCLSRDVEIFQRVYFVCTGETSV